MIPVDPRVRRAAGDADGGGADAAGRRRQDGASRLARMSIRAGRYIPCSEDLPGQPVALECPKRPRGSAGPAAEFVRQFCFRRQPGPRRVFAAPDPLREHGVNVQVGPKVLPRIIHDQPHRQCKRLQPWRTARAPSGTPAHDRTYGWFARMTTTPGQRHDSAFDQGQMRMIVSVLLSAILPFSPGARSDAGAWRVFDRERGSSKGRPRGRRR